MTLGPSSISSLWGVSLLGSISRGDVDLTRLTRDDDGDGDALQVNDDDDTDTAAGWGADAADEDDA